MAFPRRRLLLLLPALCFHGDRAMRYRRVTLMPGSCQPRRLSAIRHRSALPAGAVNVRSAVLFCCVASTPSVLCPVPLPFAAVRPPVVGWRRGARSISLAGPFHWRRRRTDGRLNVTAVDERMVGCENGGERSTGNGVSGGDLTVTDARHSCHTCFVSSVCYDRIYEC